MTKRPPHLSVVDGQGEPAKPEPPKTFETIGEALSGSGRDVLAAMRKALADKLDKGEIASNAIASAYKELRELDRLVRQFDAAEEEKAKGAQGGNRGSGRSFDTATI